MSEITEAMNMLENLPESARDGQQEADQQRRPCRRKRQRRRRKPRKAKARLRFPATVMRWKR